MNKYGVETYIKIILERFSSKINNFVNVPVNFLLTEYNKPYILYFEIFNRAGYFQYILADKAGIIKGAKKLTYALLNKENCL